MIWRQDSSATAAPRAIAPLRDALGVTHRVEDTTKHPREGASRGGLGVEETQVSGRSEDEGDALERVLVRALGAVELLQGCQRGSLRPVCASRSTASFAGS